VIADCRYDSNEVSKETGIVKTSNGCIEINDYNAMNNIRPSIGNVLP
jgi:hypothetical protein